MTKQAMTTGLRPCCPGKSGQRRGARNDAESENATKTKPTTPSPILWPVERPARRCSTGLFHQKTVDGARPPEPEQRQRDRHRAHHDQGEEDDDPLDREEADRGVE